MRAGLAVAVAASVTMALALFLTVQRNDALSAKLEAQRVAMIAAEAALVQAKTSAAVHRAHLERQQIEAERWRAVENEVQLMEGHDAPLSPLLRAAAERLYARP